MSGVRILDIKSDIKNKDFWGMLLWIMIVTYGICRLLQGNWLPNFYYDKHENKIVTGRILTSMKEFEILQPGKAVEFEINKKTQNDLEHTNLMLKFDYGNDVKKIEDYYEKQAEVKQWQFVKNDDIELKKDFGEYSISLNLKKIEGDMWQLNGYYFDE